MIEKPDTDQWNRQALLYLPRCSGMVMLYHMLRNFLCMTFAVLAVSCTTADFSSPGSPALTSAQLRLISAAGWALGRSDLSCDGRDFLMDCSGVVSAVYWKAGIDLQAAYPYYEGNGVSRIYQYLEERELLYRPDRPAPGDLIFWDDSYDRNGNGLADDELTHIGMVVEIAENGEVIYIHHDYISGVILARMYPPDASDKTRNSPMRIQSLGPTPEGFTTSGELYRAAGRGWEAVALFRPGF